MTLTPTGALGLGIGLAAIGGALLAIDSDAVRILGVVLLVIAGVVAQIGVIAVGVNLALEHRDRS